MTGQLDVLITHAKVFTADPQRPAAEAVGLRGGRIVLVGSDEEARQWQGRATRSVDAQGATLLPGFIDSHYHLLWGAMEMSDAQLNQAQTVTDISNDLRAFAQNNPDREWIVGRGIRYESLGPSQTLTRQQFDEIIADRPSLLYAFDTHTVWANSEALRRGGLLGGANVPDGSQIVMAADGTAHGELREPGAFGPIETLIPKPDYARKRALLHRAVADAASLGITSVHNMNGDMAEIGLYAALEDLGEMTVRVYVPFHVKPDMEADALEEAAAMREQYQTAMIRGGAVKFFMDGVIESTTALMLNEYADAPGNFGMANFSAEHFNQMATAADKMGLQIFVHAIGDGAVRRALDGFEAARRANGIRDSRHRVEHIELVHADDLPRFAQLDVIASMQPLHSPLTVSRDAVWPARTGPERWERGFAWQTLREAGARLVFGSDWPVVTQNPMGGIFMALNRRAWLPNLPGQQQTLSDTLQSYTRDAAYAEFQENVKGQIKPGMAADVVLLSEDLFQAPSEEIQRVHPVLTVVGGRIVYEA